MVCWDFGDVDGFKVCSLEVVGEDAWIDQVYEEFEAQYSS